MTPLSWQHPSLREERILLREPLPKTGKILAQIILSGEDVHARKVIDPLILMHLEESLLPDVVVGPAEVEAHICKRVGRLQPFEFFRN
jgi:hypothetical protein